MASLVLGFAGAAIAGKASAGIGFAIGSMIGSIVDRMVLFAPETVQNEMPEIEGVSVQSSVYGRVIPLLYGANRLAGNIIWYPGYKVDTSTETSGTTWGKGGSTTTSHTYTASFAIAFGQGPMAELLRLWADGELFYDMTGHSPVVALEPVNMEVFLGTEDQEPSDVIEGYEGVGEVPAYRGLAYIVFEDFPIDKYGQRIPNITAEFASAVTVGAGYTNIDVDIELTGNDGMMAMPPFIGKEQHLPSHIFYQNSDNILYKIDHTLSTIEWGKSSFQIGEDNYNLSPDLDYILRYQGWNLNDILVALQYTSDTVRIAVIDGNNDTIEWANNTTFSSVKRIGVVNPINFLNMTVGYAAAMFIVLDPIDQTLSMFFQDALADIYPFDLTSLTGVDSSYSFEVMNSTIAYNAVGASPDGISIWVVATKTSPATTKLLYFNNSGFVDEYDISADITGVKEILVSYVDWGTTEEVSIVVASASKMLRYKYDISADTLTFQNECKTTEGVAQGVGDNAGSGFAQGYSVTPEGEYFFYTHDGSNNMLRVNPFIVNGIVVTDLDSESNIEPVALMYHNWNGNVLALGDIDGDDGLAFITQGKFTSGEISLPNVISDLCARAGLRQVEQDHNDYWYAVDPRKFIRDGRMPEDFISGKPADLLGGGTSVKLENRFENEAAVVYYNTSSTDGRYWSIHLDYTTHGGAEPGAATSTVTYRQGWKAEFKFNIKHDASAPDDGVGLRLCLAEVADLSDSQSIAWWEVATDGAIRSCTVGNNVVTRAYESWTIDRSDIEGEDLVLTITADPTRFESGGNDYVRVLFFLAKADGTHVESITHLLAYDRYVTSPPNNYKDTWPANLAYVGWDYVDPGSTVIPSSDYFSIDDMSVWKFDNDPEIDVDGLSEAARGYTISNQVTVRGAIEMLAQAYKFDAVESEGKIKFVERGSSSARTLTSDDLGAHESGKKVTTILEKSSKEEDDLPREVAITYLSPSKKYEPRTQRAQRLQTTSRVAHTLTLPLVLSDQNARKLAETMLWATWTARDVYKFVTSVRQIDLEPTDVITVTDDDIDYLVRITKRDYGTPGLVKFEAVKEDNELYVPPDINVDEPEDNDIIPAFSPSVGTLFNLPLLNGAADDGPGFYACAYSPTNTFAGVFLQKSTNYGWQDIGYIPREMTCGVAITELADCENHNDWDMENTVTIRLFRDDFYFANQTRIQVCNGGNRLVIGNEIIQFTTKTENSDGTWTLSELRRGVLGTEHETGGHTAEDRCFLFSYLNMIRIDDSEDDIGKTYVYRFLSSDGGTLKVGNSEYFTNTARGLLPWSPVLIKGSRDVSGNLTITWTRRTRFNGELKDLVSEVPLNDYPESYDIEIMDGTTVKRTFLSETSPTVTYTAAQQNTDFGSLQSAVAVRIYQLSGEVGRGIKGESTI